MRVHSARHGAPARTKSSRHETIISTYRARNKIRVRARGIWYDTILKEHRARYKNRVRSHNIRYETILRAHSARNKTRIMAHIIRYETILRALIRAMNKTSVKAYGKEQYGKHRERENTIVSPPRGGGPVPMALVLLLILGAGGPLCGVPFALGFPSSPRPHPLNHTTRHSGRVSVRARSAPTLTDYYTPPTQQVTRTSTCDCDPDVEWVLLS